MQVDEQFVTNKKMDKEIALSRYVRCEIDPRKENADVELQKMCRNGDIRIRTDS